MNATQFAWGQIAEKENEIDKLIEARPQSDRRKREYHIPDELPDLKTPPVPARSGGRS